MKPIKLISLIIAVFLFSCNTDEPNNPKEDEKQENNSSNESTR